MPVAAPSSERHRLKLQPPVPFITVDDPRLSDYRAADVDATQILTWVNHANILIRRNRIQLLTSYPLLVSILATQRQRLFCKYYSALEEVVDCGQPLIETLADLLKVRTSTVRYLSGYPLSRMDDISARGFEALQVLDFLPNTCRPKTRDEWEAMVLYARDAHAYENPWYVARYIFVTLCELGYSAFAKNNIQRITNNRPNSICLIRDYRNFILDCFPRYLTLSFPTCERSIPLGELYLLQFSLEELVRQSDVWHREISNQGISMDTPTVAENISSPYPWPPLLSTPIELHGLTAVSVVTPIELQQEGYCLQHCVGSYAERCVLGNSHILSVRGSNGISLSTAEIVIRNEWNQWTPHLVQHCGFENAPPSKECVSLLEAVFSTLHSASGQSRITELMDFHKERRSQIEAILERDASTLTHKAAILRKVLPNYDAACSWVESTYTTHGAKIDSKMRAFIRTGVWRGAASENYPDGGTLVGTLDLSTKQKRLPLLEAHMIRRTFSKAEVGTRPIPPQARRSQMSNAAYSFVPESPLPVTPFIYEQEDKLYDDKDGDLLKVELGYELCRDLVSKHGTPPYKDSPLCKRIRELRTQFAQEFGFQIAPVRIRDNFELKPDAYRITLKGVEIGHGKVYPENYLAFRTDSASLLPAIWIEPSRIPWAQSFGYSVADASTVLAMDFMQLIRPYAEVLAAYSLSYRNIEEEASLQSL